MPDSRRARLGYPEITRELPRSLGNLPPALSPCSGAAHRCRRPEAAPIPEQGVDAFASVPEQMPSPRRGAGLHALEGSGSAGKGSHGQRRRLHPRSAACESGGSGSGAGTTGHHRPPQAAIKAGRSAPRRRSCQCQGQAHPTPTDPSRRALLPHPIRSAVSIEISASGPRRAPPPHKDARGGPTAASSTAHQGQLTGTIPSSGQPCLPLVEKRSRIHQVRRRR